MAEVTSANKYALIETTADGVLGLVTRWFPYRVWF